MGKPPRSTLMGPDAAPVLDYVDRSSPGRPAAADVHPLTDAAVREVLTQMPGWTVVTAGKFAEELIANGAVAYRRAFEMRRSLADPPPSPDWADESPGTGLRTTPVDRPAREVFAAVSAAFPPGHPDRRPERTGADEFDALSTLLSGAALGPVMELGELVVDCGRPGGDQVAAGLILNDRPDDVPWVGELFRRPDARYAGLGGLLMRRMLARAARSGLTEVGLAVSADNPAKSLYTRLGFRDRGLFTTVRVPGSGPRPVTAGPGR